MQMTSHAGCQGIYTLLNIRIAKAWSLLEMRLSQV